jgi:hypothetical protein
LDLFSLEVGAALAAAVALLLVVGVSFVVYRHRRASSSTGSVGAGPGGAKEGDGAETSDAPAGRDDATPAMVIVDTSNGKEWPEQVAGAGSGGAKEGDGAETSDEPAGGDDAAPAMAGRTSAATVMVDTSNWHEWSAEQVAGWVRTVPAIRKRADMFLDRGITGKDLPEVDESFLSDCGISSKLMKKKVLGAIGELLSTATSKVELFPASKVMV